jgi:hypothetical protein
VRVWTAHFRDDAAPVLLREGFSWGALFFGPLWLAAHRAWIPAALGLAAFILVVALAPRSVAWIGVAALMWLHGLSGRDLCHWSAAQRGFMLRHVLVGRTEAEALDRLFRDRPDLARRFAEDLK